MLSGAAIASAVGGAVVGSAVTAGALLRRATLWAPKPNPAWKPSTLLPPVEEKMITLVPGELPPGASYYAFLTSAVVPRPIAFVSTET